MRRSSRGDTEACCGNPGAPHRWDSGWATQVTPTGLPVMSHFSLPMVDRHGLSPQHHTCQQECLQMEGRTNSQYRIFSQLIIRMLLLWVLWCESVPELSLSAWNCRTEEPPPMLISCAQSSTGFSNTRRTRRALNGLQRGCLIWEEIKYYNRKSSCLWPITSTSQ